MGKLGEKFLAGREHLKRLITDFGDTPRHANIVVVAEHASEGVARKIAGGGLLPRRNHARVQPAGQRHADSLIAAEVTWKVAGENFAQSLIVVFGREFFLRFPFTRMKVGG